MLRNALSVLAILSLSGAALADDLTPPPWRGNAGTTVQHWDFSSGPAGFAPDALPTNNPFGAPLLQPLGGATWMPGFNGRTDVWDISQAGALNFRIPNAGNPAHQKDLWLQVTYFSAATVPPPSYTVSSPFGPMNLLGSTVTPLPNGWFHQLTRWQTPVCPPFETVTISPSLVGAITVVDQVVIDTLCAVPTPGAASVLAMGGLVAFRRRR